VFIFIQILGAKIWRSIEFCWLSKIDVDIIILLLQQQLQQQQQQVNTLINL